MKVIAVVNTRSGIGKSRTTWDLLVALVDSGIDATAIDYGQPGLLSAVNKSREEHGNPPMPVLAAATPAELQSLLAAKAKSANAVVLIDSQSGDIEPEISALLAKADLILIPTFPTPAHIAATAPFIRPLSKTCKRIRFLLIRTPAGGMAYDKTLLATLGMTQEDARKLLVPMSIANRPNLMKDLNQLGLGVLEAFGNARIDQESVGKASQEIRSIRQFLRDELSF